MLAIEDCLVGKLSELFTPHDVLDMSPEEIFRLASESPESTLERAYLVQKRKILESGLPILKGFQKRRSAFMNQVERGAVASEHSESKSVKTESSSEERWMGTSGGKMSPSSTFQVIKKGEASESDLESVVGSQDERAVAKGNPRVQADDDLWSAETRQGTFR